MTSTNMLGDLTTRCEFVLASSSPRRYEIIHDVLGVDPLRIMKPSFEEDLDKSLYLHRPLDYVADTCRGKAESICSELADSGASPARPQVIICSDTIVVDGEDRIYEKPQSHKQLIDNLHYFCYETSEPVRVATAVTIIVFKSPKEYKMSHLLDVTNLHFDNRLPKQFIERYSLFPGAMKAAGGITIQTACGAMVSRIDGDYYTILGLPLNKLVVALANLEI
ncbi:hypothetical protein RNJ44_02478 [Nakaseomyces bracarensis]|uniref:Maf-like protein n=1 Tax=Nakaseomyces bracarensis TaxID=273131 RepID=A0ABR4NLY4_9SACH